MTEPTTGASFAEAPVARESEFLPFDLTEIDDQALFSLAAVLQAGAIRYGSQGWRVVPLYEHINHAIAHLLRFSNGDETEDHLTHAFARCMMAVSIHKNEQGDLL